MKTVVLMAGSTLLVATVIVAGAVAADGEKELTIKQAMGALHKGPKSTFASLKTALASDSPDWAAIQKSADKYLALAESISKQDPAKGDKGSWKTQTEHYVADAKALDTAAHDKDLSAAQKAHQKLGASCKACHQVHK